MNNPPAILRIAEDRLEESEALYRSGGYEGAVYLAGYGLELILKAKVSQRLDLPNLFEENFSQSLGRQVSGLEFQVAREFRKFFLVHDLAKLFLLTGLLNQFDRDKATDSALATAWTCICSVGWSEEFRYLPRGTWTAPETREFIDAINRFKTWTSTT